MAISSKTAISLYAACALGAYFAQAMEVLSHVEVVETVRPSSFAVLTSNGAFRNASTPFNPTKHSPPFFQLFDEEFRSVIGTSPSIRVIAENDTFSFAHEAPIWGNTTNELFVASNAGGALGHNDLHHNNQVSKLDLTKAEQGMIPVEIVKVPLSNDSQMTNGGTPFRGKLLLVNSGRGDLPPNVVLVEPVPPYNSTVLLDNFYGRQFNSINDVKVHPVSKAIFFTDVRYGFVNKFRPAPLMPEQVYRLDPDTKEVRVAADGFSRCNSIAFSPDGATAYVTDTGSAEGDSTLPSTIYAYDVDEHTQVFKNRRVFAYADAGIPDGIQLDNQGNVYSSCGDGVHVWNSAGKLLGKIFIGTTSANHVFVGPGKLAITAETKVYLANIAATGMNLYF